MAAGGSLRPFSFKADFGHLVAPQTGLPPQRTFSRRGSASSPTRKVPRGTREPWRLQSPKRSWRGRKTRGDRNGPRRQTSQNRESPGFNYGECQAPSVLTAWREAPWARRLLPGRFGLSRPPVWLRSIRAGVEKFSTASEFSTAKNPDRDIYRNRRKAPGFIYGDIRR